MYIIYICHIYIYIIPIYILVYIYIYIYIYHLAQVLNASMDHFASSIKGHHASTMQPAALRTLASKIRCRESGLQHRRSATSKIWASAHQRLEHHTVGPEEEVRREGGSP